MLFLLHLTLALSVGQDTPSGRRRHRDASMSADFAKQMRAPTEDGQAIGIMDGAGNIDAKDFVANILGDLTGKTVLELGPGTGGATEDFVDKAEKIYAIEISDVFQKKFKERAKLGPAVVSGKIVLTGDESTKQVDHIPDGSLDVIFGFNLVYFLSPLADYLKVYSAKLKPGGKMAFGCKEAAKMFGSGPGADVYVNLDWEKIKNMMGEVGIKTEIHCQRMSGSQHAVLGLTPMTSRLTNSDTHVFAPRPVHPHAVAGSTRPSSAPRPDSRALRLGRRGSGSPPRTIPAPSDIALSVGELRTHSYLDRCLTMELAS